MTYLIAYDVATSYSGAQLEFRRAGTDDGIARMFATAERAWFGEIFFDGTQLGEPPRPLHEPGYALLLDRATSGRPQAYPRDAHVTVREYFDAAALITDARRHVASGAFVAAIGIRVAQRKPGAERAWDPETRALYAETIARPDDDDSRLVFADSLGTRRGSLVVVQCDLARDGLTPSESRARRRAQRELLAKHGKAWSRLDGLVKRCQFRRGFVEAAALSRDVLADDYARVFDAAPHLDSITLDLGPPMYSRGFAGAAVSSGWWPRIRGLSIDAAQLPLFGGMLGQLRALEVRGAQPAQAHQLVASGELAKLEVLRLQGFDLGGDALEAMLRAAPQLKVLDLTGGSSLDGPRPLPDSIRQLATAGSGDIPRGVEKLALSGATRGVTIDGLASLRSLDLAGADVAELHELALPKLRELRIGHVRPQIAIAIASRFGEQLELFEIFESPDVQPDELRELVAGDVTTGERSPPLLVSKYLPEEPMWDVGTVELG